MEATHDALLVGSCTQVLLDSMVHKVKGVGAEEHVLASGGGGRIIIEGDDVIGPIVVILGVKELLKFLQLLCCCPNNSFSVSIARWIKRLVVVNSL